MGSGTATVARERTRLMRQIRKDHRAAPFSLSAGLPVTLSTKRSHILYDMASFCTFRVFRSGFLCQGGCSAGCGCSGPLLVILKGV